MTKTVRKRAAQAHDWRGEMLSRIRALINDADPDMVEIYTHRNWCKDGGANGAT